MTETETLLEGDDILQALSEDELVGGYPCWQNLCAVQQDPETNKPKTDTKSLSVPFTIVTRQSKPNRNRSIIQIAPDDGDSPRNRGMMLENYRRNPVVLFNHGMGGVPFPIAKSEDQAGNFTVKAFKSKMDAVAHFSQSLPEAVQIFALIDEGILRSSSISFIPTRAKLLAAKRRNDLEDDEIDLSMGRAVEFTEGDVIEYSVVDIPADPDALRHFLDRGNIRGEKLTRTMQRVMQGMAGAKPTVGVGLPEFKPYRFREKLGEYEREVTFATHDELSAFVEANKPQRPAVDQKPQPATTEPHEPSASPAAAVQASLPPRPGAEEISAVIRSSVQDAVKPLVDRQQQFAKELKRLTGAVD